MLRTKILHGLAWRGGVAFGQHLLQIVFTIVFARMLTRADFGLIAMALLFTRLVRSISQVGLGVAVIQDQKVTEGQISALFLLNLGLNAGVSLFCCLAAPWAAAFFGQPQLVPVVQVLAWSLLLGSLAFPQVLLRKKLAFGAYSPLELGATVVANVVALLAAWRGLGVWALVVRLMVDRFVFVAGVWMVAGWRPIRPQFAGTGKHLRFGMSLLGANVCYYASQNLAAIIMGKFIGIETLGCFMIAFNLAVVPAQKVQTVLTNVLGPAFARLQTDLAQFRRKLFVSLFTLGLFFIPAMLGLAAVARDFVPLAYGEKWREAGVFLTILAGVGLIKGLEHLLRAAIIASGQAATILRITFVETAVGLPLLTCGAIYLGVVGLIGAYLLTSVLSLVLTVHFTQRAVQADGVFWRATARSFFAASLMCAAVMALAAAVPARHVGVLCAQIALGALLYGGIRLLTLNESERALARTLPLTRLVVPRR